MFLLAVVLSELDELVDVGMPGLEVDGEGSLAFPAALIDVSGCVIENSKETSGLVR